MSAAPAYDWQAQREADYRAQEKWTGFCKWMMTIESDFLTLRAQAMESGMTAGEANEAILKGMRIQCK